MRFLSLITFFYSENIVSKNPREKTNENDSLLLTIIDGIRTTKRITNYALTHFARIRANDQDDSPFFLLPNGQPLTHRVFVANLRHLLLRLGIQASFYSDHSMRVGAATSAAASGIPDHLIQVLGR